MHTTKLRKIGGSIMLAVLPAILEILRLKTGTTVGVSVSGNRLVVEEQPQPPQEREWVDAPAVGRELP